MDARPMGDPRMTRATIAFAVLALVAWAGLARGGEPTTATLDGVVADLWIEGHPRVSVTAAEVQLAGDGRVELAQHELAVGDDLSIRGGEGSVSLEDGTARSDGEVSAKLLADEPLDIRAEHFQIDVRGRTGAFTGSVVVTQGTLTLLCDRLDVTYDPETHQVSRVIAAGAVEIRQDDRLGRGQQATFDRGEGTVVLSGDPFLRQGPVQLRGTSITFRVDGGEISCDDCQAVFDGP
jgi:lipopolysaccharide transport protein LptA